MKGIKENAEENSKSFVYMNRKCTFIRESVPGLRMSQSQAQQ